MVKANNKHFRYGVLIVCIIAFFTFLIGAAPSHTNDFYVNDYADVLSEETEQKILNTAVTMYNDTTAQIVVLTIDTLDGEDIADYAVETLREWEIGTEDDDNGALIVLSVEDRKVWVSVGYGLEDTLTDIRAGQLQDEYALPYYKNDDFETGTLMLFNAIVNEVRTEKYGLEPLDEALTLSNDGIYSSEEIELTEKQARAFMIILLIPVLIYPAVYVFQQIKYLCLRISDKKHGTNRALFYREKSKETRRAILNFLLIFFIRGRHRHGGYRGGGGFGGGGGFRGGGGSGGGGGAGRSF